VPRGSRADTTMNKSAFLALAASLAAAVCAAADSAARWENSSPEIARCAKAFDAMCAELVAAGK
jgi:hypothetical protein